MTQNNDWIADKILAQEDDLMAALAAKRLHASEGRPDHTDTLQIPVPVDPVAERLAYAELQALLAAKDEGDAETVVTCISLVNFERDSFTPGQHDNPEPQEN